MEKREEIGGGGGGRGGEEEWIEREWGVQHKV